MGGRYIRSETGSLLTELTLTLPLFLIIVIGGFEVLRLSYNNVAVQILASRGVFFVGPNPCGEGGGCPNQVNAVTQSLTGLAQGLGIGGPTTSICVAPNSNPGTCLGQAPTSNIQLGAPREIFIVRVERNVPLVFGLGQYVVSSLSIGRHEPGVM